MKKAVIYILALLALIYSGRAFFKSFREVNAAEPKRAEEPLTPDKKYELFVADVTWTEAAEKAVQAGGHLATIGDEEERAAVAGIFRDSGLRYVWLGGCRSDDGAYHWVTEEPFRVPLTWWAEGEPSGMDRDGSAEDRLCMWLDGALNDVRDNLTDVVGSGRIGYIVEYETA